MKLKKMLAAVLAATMVMSSAITVSAADYNPGDSSYNPGDSSYNPGDSNYSSSDSGSSESEGSSASTSAAEYVQAANASITVAGSSVRTSIAGAYAAKSVRGAAVITPLAQVRANLGLKNGQVPAITIYDTDPVKSSKAMDSIRAAVSAMGANAKIVATLNIDLGAKENGRWVELKDGSVALVVGLPKDADTAKTYSVVCVQPGGIITIFEDQDADPATVTFAVQAGIGTYALVAQ